MISNYYKPGKELYMYMLFIDKYFKPNQYEKCFSLLLNLAKGGYPLAECTVGSFFLEGLGTDKDLLKALYWTMLSAEHGDRTGQYNLARYYEEGIALEKDIDMAKYWYGKSAAQGYRLAVEKLTAI